MANKMMFAEWDIMAEVLLTPMGQGGTPCPARVRLVVFLGSDSKTVKCVTEDEFSFRLANRLPRNGMSRANKASVFASTECWLLTTDC